MTIASALSDIKHMVRARIPISVQDRLSVRNRKRRLEARVEADPDVILVEMGNDRQTEGPIWYRGDEVNFYPTRTNLFEKDAISNYILSGWLPEKPFISKDAGITAFGSCFASHVTDYLVRQGYNVLGKALESDQKSYVISCGEGMMNSFAVMQQFQWAYGEKEFDESLWFDKGGAEAGYDADIRERTRKIFDATDVFIITLGLSEVWYNKQSGDVFWRAIPRSKFDPKRHGFKVSTVDENRQNLSTIHRFIRQHRPDATIIFTLSPVPLLATFRPVSCVTANSVSKAILRVAIDEFFRANTEDKRLLYFPSYEIVTEYFRDASRGDNRHVRLDVVERIMDEFARHYLIG
jgi:hypothetical protein